MENNSLPPELQETLERLFELFSEYTIANTQRERDELRAQIVALFSKLGVVSTNPLVKRAADLFESIRRVPAPSRVPKLVLEARNFLKSRLRVYEHSEGL